MSTPSETPGALTTGSNMWQKGGDEVSRQKLIAILDEMVATPLLRALAERSLVALALAPGARMLEVGCGTGVFLPLLARAVDESGSVVGLDHAPDFLATAQRRLDEAGLGGRVTLIEGDARDLPFPDASFDGAHCERVLIHLDDAVKALCEMRRVVRPGGMVVAAEPDWAGCRIDHPDREAFDALFERWLTQLRQPAIGLEIRRRMAEAGLIDVQVEPIIIGMHDIGVLTSYGLDLGETADAMAAEGKLDRARSAAAITWMTTASQDGTFFAYGGAMVARGTVPPR